MIEPLFGDLSFIYIGEVQYMDNFDDSKYSMVFVQ